ncbi:MAG: RDD family protein [Micromonosporaceae bacterium]
MSKSIVPGWYPDPVEETVQRYWDGEQWVGEAIPVDATPPATPPAATPTAFGPGAAPADSSQTGIDSSPQPSGTQQGDVGQAGGRQGSPHQGGGLGSGDQGQVRGGQAGAPSGWQPAPPSHQRWHVRAPGGLPPGGRPDSQTTVHGKPLGALSARFMARLVDILAVLGLNILVNSWFVYQWWQEFAPTYRQVQRWASGQVDEMPMASAEAENLQWAIMLVGLGLWFAYEVPAVAWRGQTLGKRLFHIGVVRYDGEMPGFRASFFRWFFLSSPVLLFPCLIPLQLADYLWCVWDRPLRLCLHDKFGRTVVVQATPEQTERQQQPDQKTPSM